MCIYVVTIVPVTESIKERYGAYVVCCTNICSTTHVMRHEPNRTQTIVDVERIKKDFVVVVVRVQYK